MGGTRPTAVVRRPYAYLLPPALKKPLANLRRHGIEVERVARGALVEVEVYRVEKVTRARLFQKHQPVSVEVSARKEKRSVAPGTLLVKTAQPLGSLAAYLLEPRSADGLVTWNFFDEGLAPGKDFPVLRVPARAALESRPAR
jgi:hypothetical protein